MLKKTLINYIKCMKCIKEVGLLAETSANLKHKLTLTFGGIVVSCCLNGRLVPHFLLACLKTPG